LASSSINTHKLILIIVGEQHQHTFRNDVPIQLSLSPPLLLTLFAFTQQQRKWHKAVFS